MLSVLRANVRDLRRPGPVEYEGEGKKNAKKHTSVGDACNARV